MNNNTVMQELQNLDRQIEALMKCKPLPENEVKILCEKVFCILEIAFVSYNLILIKGPRNLDK